MRERADAHHVNHKIKGTQQVIASRLAMAEQFREYPRIYYPHQLDHRGRAYPVPQTVNVQSDHSGRAYLEFADGKPLGEQGPYWLAIQLANCFGKDKLSFDDRMNWVQQNEQDILSFAGDPLHGHRFWKDAKKPWLVRAACKEWKGYREQGPKFLSHLIVSMDGTCNGYQHLSAMGRDPIGGRATNLVPGMKPEDIYRDVADVAGWRIAADAADPRCADHFWARQLLGKIDREVAKHATMTRPYGVKRGTIYKELRKTEAIKSCINPPECARYLAKVLDESIPQVAVEAGKIMTWMRQVASIIGKANGPMAWTTPTGFYVAHGPREPRKVRVTTSDCTLTLFATDEKRKIDVRKLVDGIVAHFVHSMDAAHMMLTLNRLVAEGLCHFAMVHDSFGVHACDVDLLHRILREEFVRIYSEPILQKFLDEQRQAYPDLEFPDPPSPGNLDIRQVLQSPYFFS
jgi:DNA-directed RNA polymerase, mitochondrial